MVPPTEERLHITFLGLVRLVAELHDTCYKKGFQQVSPALMKFAICGIEAYDKKSLIEMFIDKTHKYWDKILAREEAFFYNEAAAVFGSVPHVDMPSVFRNLFVAQDSNGSKIIQQSDRLAIFNIFHACIKICIKHIHEKRQPLNGKYQVSYRDDINVSEEAKKWNIALPW